MSKQRRTAKTISIPFLILGYVTLGSGAALILMSAFYDILPTDPYFPRMLRGMGGTSALAGIGFIIPGHIFLAKVKKLDQEMAGQKSYPKRTGPRKSIIND